MGKTVAQAPVSALFAEGSPVTVFRPVPLVASLSPLTHRR
jgi:hypothetical protein